MQYGTNMTLKYNSDIVLGIDNRFVTNERYSINITGLTPFTTYYFILWANNSAGNTSTKIMNFTTDQTGMYICFLSVTLCRMLMLCNFVHMRT